MIILDLSQLMVASVMALSGRYKGLVITDQVIRAMCLNTIRFNVKKFKHSHGPDVVIACDGKPYWRADIFPYYKAGRKEWRENNVVDFDAVFKSFEVFKGELKEFFPYRVIEVEGAEADDIIGVLAHRFGVDFGHCDPIKIVSGDHDFIQLQTYSNVSQWSPTQKKKVTHNNPEGYLIEHIVRGDGGDGVPNIFSDDDTLVTPGKRQTPVAVARLDHIKATVEDKGDWSETLARNFDRNRQLVDLSMIPDRIRIKINKMYDDEAGKSKKHLFNYFIKNRLKEELRLINDF